MIAPLDESLPLYVQLGKPVSLRGAGGVVDAALSGGAATGSADGRGEGVLVAARAGISRAWRAATGASDAGGRPQLAIKQEPAKHAHIETRPIPSPTQFLIVFTKRQTRAAHSMGTRIAA
jgi:hypothetical protein